MSLPSSVSSMKPRTGSVGISTKLENLQRLADSTVSVNGMAYSEYYNSDQTSLTIYSRIESEVNYEFTYNGNLPPQAHHPDPLQYYLQSTSEQPGLTTYPKEINEDDQPLATAGLYIPERVQPTSFPDHHLVQNPLPTGTLEAPTPQTSTKQDMHQPPPISPPHTPARHNTQNRQNLTINLPSTPPQTPQARAGPPFKTSVQTKSWSATPSPEERMRLGHFPRWESEEQRDRYHRANGLVLPLEGYSRFE